MVCINSIANANLFNDFLLTQFSLWWFIKETVPTDIKLNYVPYTEESSSILACSRPIELDLASIFPGKTVVIVSVPGAFTPTCTESHIPAFVKGAAELKAKGVSDIIVLSSNDAFVLSAWGKALGDKGAIKFACDPQAKFSSKIGLAIEKEDPNVFKRTSRYALIVKDGKVYYVGQELAGGVTVSGFDDVLKAL